MAVVSLVRVGANERDVLGAIEKSLDLLGFEFSDDIENVVVKPNLCYYWDYSTGETTDPTFVGALVDLLRERISSEVTVSVVESDASAMKCRNAFQMLNYEKMAREKRVSLVNLSHDSKERVKVNLGKRSFTFGLAKTIRDADLFVNVPKIKYMPRTRISCALKNMYGCNPFPRKSLYHAYLDEVIVGLNKILKPDLCLVDSVIARGVYTKRLGLVMASCDSVAIDAVASRIAGLNPRRINHIALAEKAGLGHIHCETKGESVDYFATRFPREDSRQRIQSALVGVGVSVMKKLGRYME